MSSHSRPFSADIRIVDAVAIIDLHGEINGEADAQLTEAYAATVTHGTPTVLLNFADVNYINSTGIALIVGLLAQTRKAKRRLITCGLSDHYAEIFRITRLSDFMAILPDEAAALSAALD
jgi:anti-anti-sigma factor